MQDRSRWNQSCRGQTGGGADGRGLEQSGRCPRQRGAIQPAARHLEPTAQHALSNGELHAQGSNFTERTAINPKATER